MNKNVIKVLGTVIIIALVSIGTGCASTSNSKSELSSSTNQLDGTNVTEKKDGLYNDEGEAVLSTASSSTTKGAAKKEEEEKSEIPHKPNEPGSAYSSNRAHVSNNAIDTDTSHVSNNAYKSNDEHPANKSNDTNELNNSYTSNSLHIADDAFNADSAWDANEKNDNYSSNEANAPHEYQTATPKNHE